MQIYLYLSAIGMLLLGGALACYGEQLLFYFSILSFSTFEFISFLLLKWMYCFVCLCVEMHQCRAMLEPGYICMYSADYLEGMLSIQLNGKGMFG